MHAKEYQQQLASCFLNIFENQSVCIEWDSLIYDPHSGNHAIVYGPRHDLAVGPFNSFWELDIGKDATKIMQKHPFTKRLYKDYFQDRDTLSRIWNSRSRCFLAVEIEFSGSQKHMLGSIINACVSGSLAIIVSKQVHMDKITRLCNYLMRLEDYGYIKLNMLRNIIVFEHQEFLDYLSDYWVNKKSRTKKMNA